MPTMTLVSAKGSPGVTTTAAALATIAQCSGEPAWWVELDPSGGSGSIRSRRSCPASEPTLAEVSRELRGDRTGADWRSMAVEAPPGVPAVLAPTGEVAASAVIGEGPERWAEALHTRGLVVVDGGRWDRRQPTASRIAGSDLVVVACRSTVEGVEHVRHWVGGLRQVARCPVVLAVVGTRPYSGSEVARATGLPLAGVIEWRQGDVSALWARGTRRRQILRSWLGRSATRTFSGIQDRLAHEVATGRSPAERQRVVDDRKGGWAH